MTTRAPILELHGDNFTDPVRTPWGGEVIARWKQELGIQTPAGLPLGESWEVSFGPELPSKVQSTGRTLKATVGDDLEGYLGDEAALGTSALLVKLLDAAAPLSVQIHPADDDAQLGSDESGKPECWYVAAAAPGASILLGLSEHTTPELMRTTLDQNGDVGALLTRVAVEAGDFFLVPPGTPHAIGSGVTIVEPQRISPGKRGVTYRYWDHNRRYDPQGRLDPLGAPRTLHVEAALRVTDWEHGRGEQLLKNARLRAPSASLDVPLTWLELAGTRAALPFNIDVARLSGSGPLPLPAARVARSITVIEGKLEASSEGMRTLTRRGESIFVAATAEVALFGSAVVAVVASTPADRRRRR